MSKKKAKAKKRRFPASTQRAGKEGQKVGPGNPPKEYRWKPGQSGNPSGQRDPLRQAIRRLGPHPIPPSLYRIVKRMLGLNPRAKTPVDVVKMTWDEFGALRHRYVAATSADFRAMPALIDQTEGKPMQPIADRSPLKPGPGNVIVVEVGGDDDDEDFYTPPTSGEPGSESPESAGGNE